MPEAWNERPWHVRQATLGDTAEGKFEQIQDTLGVKYIRFGLNRPPFKVVTLPRLIRHMPDYLMADRLVEVQGIGRDAVLKLKPEKYAALTAWNDLVYPVELWVWDSHRSKYAVTNLADLPLDQIGEFNDGNTYFAIGRADVGPWSSPP